MVERNPILTRRGTSTMSVIRVGSSGQYATGWEAVFGGGKAKAVGAAKRSKKAAKKPAQAKAAKPAKKPAAKKSKSRRG
jgi:hypothetical protein